MARSSRSPLHHPRPRRIRPDPTKGRKQTNIPLGSRESRIAVRHQNGGHWIPGERAVSELLSADPSRLLTIYVEAGRPFLAVQKAAQAVGVKIEVAERDWMEQIVGLGLARGIVAEAKPPRLWDLSDLVANDSPENRQVESPRQLLVVLDEVVDPQNFGAILRSSEFFGVSGVVWTRDRSAPLSPTAVRASAGASERIKLCVVTNLASSLEYLKKREWWVVGCVAEGGQSLTSFQQSGLPQKLVVVLGSEQRGLRRLTRKCCDYLITIEGRGMIGSLNVSNAAAVVIEKLA